MNGRRVYLALPDFPAERRQLDRAVVPGWKWNALLAMLDQTPPSPIG